MKPKLRFQGFHDDWEEKKLGEVSDIRTGNADLKDKVDNGIYPFFVRSANIERINSYDYDGEAILIPGDGKIGEVYHYIDGKFNYHQRVYKISDLCSDISTKYIYYFMIQNFKKEALRNSVKATVDSLRLPTIKGFTIKVPSLPEQEKIAEFLSKQDELIEKEEEKLSLLKERKKGWMQQIFSQTIRFKDENGQDYPAWEEKKFLSLFDLIIDYRGKTPKKLGFDWGGNIPALSALNVKDGYIDWQADIHFGSSELCDIWMKEPLAYNDILFTMEAPLGNVALVPDNKSYILSQRVIALRTKQNYPVFIFQMMRSNSFQSIISKLSTGTTAKGINQKGLNKISVLVPSLPEQEKIAEFLSKQDELIGKEEEKLSLLREQKKGFLQQMFV